MMKKFVKNNFRKWSRGGNFCLLLGIVFGLFLHANLTYLEGCPGGRGILDDEPPLFEKANVFEKPIAPRLIKPEQRNGSRKPTAKVVRPRYYTTELGIREKLFVGIFTSEEKIPLQAVHINKTLTHLVDKVKFFITAQKKLKTKLNLSGVVGFTDTRYRYRPFQVIKYIGDTFSQDYDYYFLMNDYDYLNAGKLKETVKKISVKHDVYLGTIVKDGSYCDLDAGILISNSVLQALKEHLEWCVINAVSDDHSANIGRCVHHSTGLVCQNVVQGQSLQTFKLKHFSLKDHLEELQKNPSFDKAITIYPITEAIDFHLLHIYFSEKKLLEYNRLIESLSANLNESWPAGIRPGAKPATRFDVPNTCYFNMTHVFFPDDFTNIRKHNMAEQKDIQIILNKILNGINHNELTFSRLINGYRTFDMSRGLDYIFDLEFKDLNYGKAVIKRFEVCKPLGGVEFVPVPYVTENSRIAIVLPVQETEISQGLEYLQQYDEVIMEKREKAVLIMILLYQYDSESKGEADPYIDLKNFALSTSDKYKSEDTKIVWISVRLPQYKSGLFTVEKFPSLNFAIVDLALRKIGVDIIILVTDIYVDLTVDFLNRVRMNTISNFQIFSPIPFKQYNPNITKFTGLEVNKNVGHFDREEFRYISFYGKDYVPVRKAVKDRIPIVRVDNDIEKIISSSYSQDGNIFKLFFEHTDDIHCMRATDMSFKVKYRPTDIREKGIFGEKRAFLGNKGQLATYLMEKDPNFMKD